MRVHKISGQLQATSKLLHYQCNVLYMCCVHTSFPQDGAYFPVEHLRIKLMSSQGKASE